MLTTIRQTTKQYPPQFWWLFGGMAIYWGSISMVWPFLLIYVADRLGMPLSQITYLVVINSITQVIASSLAGPIIDRFGRKGVVSFSLIGLGLGFFMMSRADSLIAYIVILSLAGLFQPLYQVGVDTMLADLIPQAGRAKAYSMTIIAGNLGFAVGASTGGVLVSKSYNLAFYAATAIAVMYGLFLALRIQETMPAVLVRGEKKRGIGYGPVLKDRKFMAFALFVCLAMVCPGVLWSLLPMYLKQYFQIQENLGGLLPAYNALMITLLQVSVTQMTARFAAYPRLAAGAFLFAMGIFGIAFGQGFYGFLASVSVYTLGEMLMMPTAISYASTLAPEDMRGRYLSLFRSLWRMLWGLGPVFAGYFNDFWGPKAIWYGTACFGLVSGLALLAMAYLTRYKIETAS